MNESTAAVEQPLTQGVTEWRLEASLLIQDVEAQSKVLARLLHSGSAIHIDVSPLVAVDTAGVQLLLALRLEGARRGVSLRYRGESAVLSQALQSLGLRDAVLEGTSNER